MSAKQGGVARTSTTFVNGRALAHASHHATRSSVSYPGHAVWPLFSQRQKCSLTQNHSDVSKRRGCRADEHNFCKGPCFGTRVPPRARSSVSYPGHAVRPRYSQRQKSTLTWRDACKRSGRRCFRGVKIRPGVLPRGRGHATACAPTLHTHGKGRVSGTQQRPPHSFPPTEAEDTAGRVHLPKKGVSHKKCSEGGGGKIHEDDPVEGRRRVGEEGEGVGSPQTPLYRNEHVTERRSDQ